MPPKDTLQLVEYWAAGARYELKSASSLFNDKQWMTSMFHGHLAIQKALKAVFVYQRREHAPLLHSLPFLAGKLDLEFDKAQMKWLEDMNQYNIEGRYPEDIEELEVKLRPDIAEVLLKESKEMVTWLLKALRAS